MANYLISGATGFVGSALTRALEVDGHRVFRLTRRRNTGPRDMPWDPESGRIDQPDALAAAKPDVVINLAGEPIAQRWTKKRMRRIRDSRVNGTTALARAIAALPEKPRAFVSGSAIGYYGSQRGDELLDENSSAGRDYLAETAAAWERAAASASDARIRTVIIRTGIVLGRDGGALQRMLPPFRLGVGGRIGSGRQWMSWISLEDVARGIRFLAESADISGPVNLVAPQPVQNREFAVTLASVLHRPAIVPVPALALKLAFGRMADDTILASQRVLPQKLAGAGFEFRHPRLDEALRFELRR